MPILHRWEDNLLVRDNVGVVHTHEILESLIKLSGHPNFDEMRYLLASWDKATDIQVGVDDVVKIRTVVATIEKSNPNVRSVLYGFNDQISTSLAYLYEALSIDSLWTVQVVETEEQARHWLLSEDPAKQHLP